MLRATAIAAAGLLLSACLMSRQYDQALDSPLTVAKDDILLSGHEDRIEIEGGRTILFDGPLAHEQGQYAVRYMGLDGNADPVLRVLSVRRGRTDVAVELAETDRVDLSGFGAPSITVVVVEASDAVLTYRLLAEGPFKTSLR